MVARSLTARMNICLSWASVVVGGMLRTDRRVRLMMKLGDFIFTFFSSAARLRLALHAAAAAAGLCLFVGGCGRRMASSASSEAYVGV